MSLVGQPDAAAEIDHALDGRGPYFAAPFFGRFFSRGRGT
jgi:hypothetical protein